MYTSVSKAGRSGTALAVLLCLLVGCFGSSPPSQDDVQKFLEKTSRTDEKVTDLRLISVKKNERDCNTFVAGDKEMYVVRATYVRNLGNCAAMKAPMPKMNCGALPFDRQFCLYKSDGQWAGDSSFGAY